MTTPDANWWRSLLAALLLVAPTTACPQDVAAGERLFGKCRSCHSLEPGRNGIGPSLAGIVGRKSAIVAGYAYSPAMKAKMLVWTPANIDRFITKPRAFVPGTKMGFPGYADAKDRANVVAYLGATSRP